jgi:ubiquinone/menaquinone biosynthesis C-methylase UbiE
MSSLLHPFTEIVLPRMAISANDRILDLGCGDGWASRAMAALTTEGLVVGIDSSGDAIRAARRQSGDFDNILYIEADAEENPWQDNFFSHVVLIESLGALRDPAAALRHLHRVMAPGATIWIAEQLADEANDKPLADQLLDTLQRGGLLEMKVDYLPPSADGGKILLITASKPPES